MTVVLVEHGYEEMEADVFSTVEDARKHLVDELDFLTDEQFNILVESGSYERSWCKAKIYKDYKIIGSKDSLNLIDISRLESIAIDLENKVLELKGSEDKLDYDSLINTITFLKGVQK